jgi:hypothetical protein
MIAINFRWPTLSTMLKNSDLPPIFPSPPPLLLYDWSKYVNSRYLRAYFLFNPTLWSDIFEIAGLDGTY